MRFVSVVASLSSRATQTIICLRSIEATRGLGAPDKSGLRMKMTFTATAAFALAATMAAVVPAYAQSAARGHVRCPNGGVYQGKFYCNVKPVTTGQRAPRPDGQTGGYGPPIKGR
jgi:hypothetical protein